MADNQNSTGAKLSAPEVLPVFQPLRDQLTGAELVVRTPAPNSSAPAVPLCSVGVSAPKA